MHLIIPFASVLAEAGQYALQTLVLPHLETLLSLLTATVRDGGDEYSLSMPHERALACAWGLAGDDGALPFAALEAQRDGIQTGDLAWGLLTPAHWRVGSDQLSLLDPDLLALDEGESRALFDAVHGLFQGEGWTLRFGAPLRWYAAHASLADLPCASIDRAIGRNVDLWLTNDPRARQLRRLQNEVQMLLYRHPVNEAREARGALAINSFWLSGCGVAQSGRENPALHVDGRLRAPALAEDWERWVQAWHRLDAEPLREAVIGNRRGEPFALTLCGERAAQRFETLPRKLWSRLAGALHKAPAQPVLMAL